MPLLAVLASLFIAAPAAAAERVYAVDRLTNKLKVKPGKLSFSDVEMTELRWKR